MNEPTDPITIALRIPGQCSHPRELIQRLSAGFRLTAETLTLPHAQSLGPFEAGEHARHRRDELRTDYFSCANPCRQLPSAPDQVSSWIRSTAVKIIN